MERHKVDDQVTVSEAFDSSDNAQPSRHRDVSLAVFVFPGGISGYLPDSCYAKIELSDSPGSGNVCLRSQAEATSQAIPTAW